MKKFFLSLFVILGFTGYALRQRFGTANTPLANSAVPSTLQQTQTSAQNPTNTDPNGLVNQGLLSDNGGNANSGSAPPPAGTGTANTTTQNTAPTTPASNSKQGMSSGMGNSGMMGQYKNGTYVGAPADALYGNIQVRVTIKNGRLVDVHFLQYPNDRQHSVDINSQAMPYLKTEAIQAQSANVDIISGATDTSYAFQQSLASALSQAS